MISLPARNSEDRGGRGMLAYRPQPRKHAHCTHDRATETPLVLAAAKYYTYRRMQTLKKEVDLAMGVTMVANVQPLVEGLQDTASAVDSQDTHFHKCVTILAETLARP